MIRDPSDGSVRNPHGESPLSRSEQSVREPRAPVPDTGIRQPTKTDAQERLERSREWLKFYMEQRNARGGYDTELQADGNSGDGQGETESGISGKR